ncbi:unnamed protein product, partial [Chrysoparadoxa australica]
PHRTLQRPVPQRPLCPRHTRARTKEAPMTDNIHHIPLTDINPNALPRDRTSEDAEADYELMQSIFIAGLRQPVEVWELSEQTDDGHRYGLI